MQTLSLCLPNGHDYTIAIAKNLLSHPSMAPFDWHAYTKIMVLTNPTVSKLYEQKLMDFLAREKLTASLVLVPDGEAYKTVEVFNRVIGDCLQEGLDRKALLVTFGGGVIGDLGGFVAASYMRGIHYLHIPTTLLAQVDSSIGGKVGINHEKGKNMIGAFWQPQLVLTDPAVLYSLSERDYLSGLAEVVKYGMILDADFFAFLETHITQILSRDMDILTHIIYTSAKWKAHVVMEDEKENGLRAILNYGHTLGHAIEAATHYTVYTHGEAVAIGMVYAAALARYKKRVDPTVYLRQKTLLEALGLPVALTQTANTPLKSDILTMMKSDKKFKKGLPTFILPEKIGTVRIDKTVSFQDIQAIL